MTKFICIASQKGGVGKSSLTIMLASWLQYNMKKQVAIIDADNPQYSLMKDREDNITYLEDNPTIEKKFTEQGIPVYKVEKSTIEGCLEKMDEYEEQGYEYVFIDLPGTVGDEKIYSIYNAVDFIFIPFDEDKMSFRSSLELAYILNTQIKGKNSAIKKVVAFWNKFNPRMNKEVFEAFNEIILNAHFDILMQSYMGHTRRLKEFALRNTLFAPAEKYLDGTVNKEMNLNNFIREFVKIIEN